LFTEFFVIRETPIGTTKRTNTAHTQKSGRHLQFVSPSFAQFVGVNTGVVGSFSPVAHDDEVRGTASLRPRRQYTTSRHIGVIWMSVDSKGYVGKSSKRAHN
jgi:hypothetical protein